MISNHASQTQKGKDKNIQIKGKFFNVSRLHQHSEAEIFIYEV